MADLEQVVNDLNLASQSLQELREKYDGALDLLDDKNTEITGALDSAKSDALQEIQTISDTATSQISQLKDTSLNLVNEAKNTATTEISNKKEEVLGEFSQATSEFNSTKEEAISQIEQAKAEQGEKITALEQAKENIVTELSKKAKLLTQNLEWTISNEAESETNFNLLSKALNEAKKYTNLGFSISILLKSGFIFNEILTLRDVDLSFVKISSEDEFIGISQSLIADNNSLITGSRCKLPSILINIDMINSTGENARCFSLYDCVLDIHGKHIKNCSGYGIYAGGNSMVSAYGSSFEGCNTAIHSNTGAFIDANGANFLNNTKYGCFSYLGGRINAVNSIFNQENGVCFQNGGGLIFTNGTNFNASSATKSNIPFNQISSAGITFGEGV